MTTNTAKPIKPKSRDQSGRKHFRPGSADLTSAVGNGVHAKKYMTTDKMTGKRKYISLRQLKRMVRRGRMAIVKGVTMPKAMLQWEYENEAGTHHCYARTRSEARAQFKNNLGLKRIPAGDSPSLVHGMRVVS